MASSCKKDVQEDTRPKTFADFEKITATDVDFNNFISTSLKLEKMVSSYYSPSVVVDIERPRSKIFTKQELEELKSIKDFESLTEFLKIHKVENVEQKITYLKDQSLHFYNFISKYPEYSKLSLKEKDLLISSSLKNKDKSTYILQTSSASNGDKQMFANGDPMQAYAIAIQGCQDSYRTAFRAIWAGADLTMIATSFETAGIGSAVAFTAACVATYYADQERGNCMNLAANLLFNEL